MIFVLQSSSGPRVGAGEGHTFCCLSATNAPRFPPEASSTRAVLRVDIYPCRPMDAGQVLFLFSATASLLHIPRPRVLCFCLSFSLFPGRTTIRRLGRYLFTYDISHFSAHALFF